MAENPLATFIGLILFGAILLAVWFQSDAPIAPWLGLGGIICIVAAVVVILNMVRR